MLTNREFELPDFEFGETFHSKAELPPPLSQHGSVPAFISLTCLAPVSNCRFNPWFKLPAASANSQELQHHPHSLNIFLEPLLSQGERCSNLLLSSDYKKKKKKEREKEKKRKKKNTLLLSLTEWMNWMSASFWFEAK